MYLSKAIAVAVFLAGALVISGCDKDDNQAAAPQGEMEVAAAPAQAKKEITSAEAEAEAENIKQMASESKAMREAPAFELKNYDGKEVGLADFKGKYVVLEWFNYECPFCKYHYETETTMVDLAEKYEDKNVQFISVNSTSHQSTGKNKAFAEKYNVPYPILDDRSGKVGRAYDAKRTPHMFIIDPKGYIVYEGAIDNAPLGKVPRGEKKINYVDRALTELLADKRISIPKTKEYGCTVKYAK